MKPSPFDSTPPSARSTWIGIGTGLSAAAALFVGIGASHPTSGSVAQAGVSSDAGSVDGVSRIHSESSTGVLPTQTFANLARRVLPSVVNISTQSTPKRLSRSGTPEDFFRHFFNGPRGLGAPFEDQEDGPGGPGEPQQPGLKQVSLGTGFVIDEKGLILTNHHVIDGADEIRITFTEDEHEKAIKAKVVGDDPTLDLALLEIKTDRKLTPLPLGDSDQVDVGEYVMAVGNPFGQGHSVTHGIISFKGRNSPQMPLANYLQTDAPINPGNSGGPLVNLRGEVIGINNAIDARAQGIGFAIPSKVAISILPQLRTGEKISRGYLGVSVQPLDEQLAMKLGLPSSAEGVVIGGTAPGEPAFKAGLRAYDLITSIDGKAVKSPSDVVAQVASARAGKEVWVEVLRGGSKLKLKVALGERPTRTS